MRSLLFVPANDSRKLAKSLSSGADALILDLEDAVPDSEKARARGLCSDFLQENSDRATMFVRVNGVETGMTSDDLAAVVKARPFGVMLPKSSSAKDVDMVNATLSALEARDGVPLGSIRVLPVVTESALGLLEIQSYARERCARLCGMLWGGEDLSADIGAISSRGIDGRYSGPYVLARSLTLLGATAARVDAIDAVYTDFRDLSGLRAESAEALWDGFSAKAAIHPDQVAVINEVFTPSDETIAHAKLVISAFEQSPGVGAVAIDGKMFDRPHLRSAHRILARVGGA
jgi:citrate lyase subunit beta / citryl-CoA lyase